MKNKLIYNYNEKPKYKILFTIYNKLTSLILFILLYIICNWKENIKKNQLINFDKTELKSTEDFIINLNKYSIYRESKYILLFDYIYSPICEDFNAFTIFEYYQKNNFDNAYYVLNEDTELFKFLVKQNKTKNIIPYKNHQNNNHLFHFLLNSKIIIQSYALFFFQAIVSRVKYLKFLYICHAVNYFKTHIIKIQLSRLDKRKQNIILTSPYEYNLYKKFNLYDNNSMHKGGLARYDRLNYVKKNSSENKCLLISFTYRSFKNSIFKKSLYKKNINKLINDESLNSILEENNLGLIIIQHHNDVRRGRKINKIIYPKIKLKEQKYLAYYIEQCSLFITDFSSISFDFMFQNKPVLFYHLDKKDKIKFKEKSFMEIDNNNSIYFNNVFSNQEDLINKIKYYVNRNFSLEEGLKEKYKVMFYNKNNITQKILNIINNIIESD